MSIEYTAPISNKENPALKVTKFEPMIGWDPSTRIVNKVDLNTIDQAITRLRKLSLMYRIVIALMLLLVKQFLVRNGQREQEIVIGKNVNLQKNV